jgi:hypothetical protein
MSTIVWTLEENGWNKDTEKCIGIKIERKRTCRMNQNKMVQADNRKHHEDG